MKFIDLFAGVGGCALGLEAAGMTCVAHSEIEDYPRRILRQHWPKVPLFGDIKDIRGKDLPSHDVISAGVPCQGNSTAGSRRGVHDERWLWPEVRRLVDETRPRYLLVENPPGLLSVNAGQAFAQILGDLDELGYACEWSVFSAARLGARHLRKRVWIVAYPVGELLREQPGRGSGEGRPGSPFAREHGPAWGPDADGERAGLEEPARLGGHPESELPAAQRGHPRGAQLASDGDGDGGGQRGPGRPAGRGARVPNEARRDGSEAGASSDGDRQHRDVGGHRAGQDGGQQQEPPHLRRGQGANPSPDGGGQARALVGRRSVFGEHAIAALDGHWDRNTGEGGVWSTGCRLGGALHGLPQGPHHPEGWGWECGVPRVDTHQPHWKERIKAQGNAACPPCAEAVGRLIMDHAGY